MRRNRSHHQFPVTRERDRMMFALIYEPHLHTLNPLDRRRIKLLVRWLLLSFFLCVLAFRLLFIFLSLFPLPSCEDIESRFHMNSDPGKVPRRPFNSNID